jgi:translin
VDLGPIAELAGQRFEGKMAAREQALAAARRSIRCSANAIRAVHRAEWDEAHRLMDESREALRSGRDAVRGHPDVYHAGFLQDAQKEYAEARLTEALVTGRSFPGPDELEVDLAPFLGGMAEAIGEGRRAVLDLLRRDDVAEAERLVSDMEDVYLVLVAVDFPDAITGHLRRLTDAARGILERTRGDLVNAAGGKELRDALDRHARMLEERSS